MMVWVELLIRAAAVYVAVLFLPLALASLAWPAIAHWCRRLVDTLVALVLGKFVIVVGAEPGRRGPGRGHRVDPERGRVAARRGRGFASVLGGAALLLLAGLRPLGRSSGSCPSSRPAPSGHLEGLEPPGPARGPPVPVRAWPRWPCG